MSMFMNGDDFLKFWAKQSEYSLLARRQFDLQCFQREQKRWSERNFGEHDYRQPFMGLVEEVGELSHALLKQEQGIRGSHEKHEDDARDAVGDIVIYLADLCSTRGWSLEDCVVSAWRRVQERDWKKDPTNGGANGGTR